MSDPVKILTKFVMTPQNVIHRIGVKNKKVLFKTGAYVRTTMQRSMRYAGKKKQVSEPGQPPLAHKNHGALLRKLITFAVNFAEGSVIIGPKKFGSGQSVPELLDKGGTARPNKAQLKSRFKTGLAGPIRQDGATGKFVFAKLETSAQVDRASQLVLGENQVRTTNAAFHIAPRPFTKPVFSDGARKMRELISTIKP